jgi:hypothetical protein
MNDLDEQLDALPGEDALDQEAQEIIDIHEVMHGRQPMTRSPLIDAVEEQKSEDEHGLDETPDPDLADDSELDELIDEAPMADEDTDLDDDLDEPLLPAQAARTRRRAFRLRGQRVLAAHDGEVAEGLIIKVMPFGDMELEFEGEDGGSTDIVPLDMILDPEFDRCPFCDKEPCVCVDEETEEGAEEEAESKSASRRPRQGGEKDCAVITVDDLGA